MQVILIITSILLIALVLLQAGKTTEGNVITGGGSSDLFKNRKERGGELFITRFTFLVGAIYFIICLVQGF